ncbi:MAG: imidazole glycerol phosphate synthase cyclase subunit [Candidatus Wildermuthbacteria bacterium]|nr:imidazole glycerol phosphate synthase cyclase subunit [Candidatus Wildermuthbacteria bacterium]
MLKKRLIACLLWNNGNIVQSMRFKHTNSVGSAITAVDFFHTWAIDEIILLDVSRDDTMRGKFFEIVRELSNRLFIPLTVGGKIRDTETMRRFFSMGADKICVNTAAVKNPELLEKVAATFGAQAIVVSIDTKLNNGKYEVFVSQGSESTGLDPVEWARTAEQRGAGEIFLTSINQDGSKKGYDLELIKSVSEAVSIPVIASGGVGEWQHFVDGIVQGKADAVSAANIFHYFEQSTKKAKDYMLANGIDIRKPVFYTIKTPRNPKYAV